MVIALFLFILNSESICELDEVITTLLLSHAPIHYFVLNAF